MEFSVFVNFDGNCREAVKFYAGVFRLPEPVFMTYGETPGETAEKDKDLIMYADLKIGDCNVMFMDFPSGMECVKGNQIQLTVSDRDKKEVERLFRAFKDGGRVETDLQETFWSGLYGMVTDRFGVQWHIMHDGGEPA